MGMWQAVSCVWIWLAAMVGISLGKEGASEWIHHAWQTDEGLPDNSVTGIVQTRDSFLWVATRGGLLHFNGVDFTTIPLPGISNRVIRASFLDAQGRVWVAMERQQVACLDPEGARTFGPAEGMPDRLFSAIAGDKDGAVWVASANGLTRIQDGRCTDFGVSAGWRTRPGGRRSCGRSLVFARGRARGVP